MAKKNGVRIDAAVLAGTHLEKDKLIYGQNKSFLEFHGKPVVQWVVEALAQAKRIDRIVVVGPIEKVKTVLEHSPVNFIPVEQRGQMIQNAWVAFLALCPQAAGYPTDLIEYLAAEESGGFRQPEGIEMDRPYLYISGDVPLVIPEAIDDFIDRCEINNYDMFYGITEEEDLKPYYPTPTQKGIKRPYVHFADSWLRVSNIQLVKPLKLGRLYLVQSGYNVRKMKLWRNLFRLFKIVITLPYGMRAVGFISALKFSAHLHKYGLGKWANPVENRCKRSKLEWYLSHFLKTRFFMVSSPYGGLSIDIDDAEDYEILKQFFYQWLELQTQIAISMKSN
ncbi:NTP transferase domain-containing protein [candidate division CSSED10-310 bacterium]|uniref:NTP transferase domain-containing protein n=1 Tax=candidate division CSSED10-310 bacterium TaxID=2855610 RepID=A0ABV6Z042_UNCC1